MILLYTALIVCLVVAKFVVDRRVARLEKKYLRTADEADHLLAEAILKDAARPELLTIAGVPVKKTQVKSEVRADPAQAAKRTYLLGLLVQKRDRLADKHDAWDHRADRLKGAIARVRAWKGRKLPYTLGALDVSTVMYLVDRYGLGEYLSPERVVEVVNTYFTN